MHYVTVNVCSGDGILEYRMLRTMEQENTQHRHEGVSKTRISVWVDVGDVGLVRADTVTLQRGPTW